MEYEKTTQATPRNENLIDRLKNFDFAVLTRLYRNSQEIREYIDAETADDMKLSQKIFHFKNPEATVPLCICGNPRKYKDAGVYKATCGSQACKDIVEPKTAIDISRKLELKITKDSDGRSVDLGNMSLAAAKSLNTMLQSLIKIVEATPHENDISIQVVKGSATIVVEGLPDAIGFLEKDFHDVVSFKSNKKKVVDNWRNIQDLIAQKNLIYEVNFYKNNNTKESVLDKIQSNRFKLKKDLSTRSRLVFFEGTLVGNGGVNPNVKVMSAGAEKIIRCTKEEAIEAAPKLYQEVWVAAWKKNVRSKVVYELVSFYDTKEEFEEYREFIYFIGKFEGTDSYIAIQKKIKQFIDQNDFGKVGKTMQLFNSHDADITSLKSILVITKTFKNHPIILEVRSRIKNLLDAKLSKPNQ